MTAGVIGLSIIGIMYLRRKSRVKKVVGIEVGGTGIKIAVADPDVILKRPEIIKIGELTTA